MATSTPPVGAPIATYTPDPTYGPKPTNEENRAEAFARLGLYTGDPEELPEELRPPVEADAEPVVEVDEPKPVFTPSTTTGASS